MRVREMTSVDAFAFGAIAAKIESALVPSCALAGMVIVLCAVTRAPRCLAQLAEGDPARPALQQERERLQNEALSLYAAGKVREAVDAGKQMLAVERRLLGDDHIYVLYSIEWLGALTEELDDWTAVDAYRTEAAAWHERHADVEPWNGVNDRLKRDRARRILAMSASEREQLRQRNAMLAESTALLADAHYRAALAKLEAAADLDRQLFGAESYDYALRLKSLSQFQRDVGDLDAAGQALAQSLRLLKTLCGERHPEVAAALIVQGDLLTRLGDFRGSVHVLEEALPINKSAWGDSSAVADNLDSLAAAYLALGDYAQALPLFREAVRIQRGIRGGELMAAQFESHLAHAYSSSGDFSRAEEQLRQAIEIVMRAKGRQHPHYANMLSQLGDLNFQRGDAAAAEPLYRDALAILQSAVGDDHPECATALNNLAAVYRALGKYAEAATLYSQSLAIKEKRFGTDNPSYATTLANLAVVKLLEQDLDQAEQLGRKALGINERAQSTMHPEYGRNLTLLAFIDELRGAPAEAAPLYRQALEIAKASLDSAALVQTERSQLLNARLAQSAVNRYLSCLIRLNRSDEAYRAVLAWKNSTLLRQRRIHLAAAAPQLRPLLEELRETTSEWATLVRNVPTSPAARAPWQQRLDGLVAKREAVEAKLSAASAAYAAASTDASLDDVQASLPVDAALVDFVEFGYCDLPKDGQAIAAASPASAAFIVKHDGPVVMMYSLIEKRSQLIDQWRTTFGMGVEGEAAGSELRKTLWEPLATAIGDATTVLISPEGALGRLPFAALPGKRPGTYLLEDYRLALVPAPRLIPALAAAAPHDLPDVDLLLVGDVDYGPFHPESTPANAARRPGAGPWPRLPGAAEETREIKQLFREAGDSAGAVVDLAGVQATEARFRELAPRARWIHLATHGFFAGVDAISALPTQLQGAQRGTGDPGGRDASNSGSDAWTVDVLLGQAPPPSAVDPMVLSGVVLAGANSGAVAPTNVQNELNGASESAANSGDDGVLDAAEMTYLPLAGVDLAVLSACETGRGEAAAGEGLLGIQRALQVAGVRNSIASLWKVDDLATQRLMTRFYRNLLERKESYLDALRDAQLEMLAELRRGSLASDDVGRLVDRGADPPTHQAEPSGASPRFWAAFTFSGDWR